VFACALAISSIVHRIISHVWAGLRVWHGLGIIFSRVFQNAFGGQSRARMGGTSRLAWFGKTAFVWKGVPTTEYCERGMKGRIVEGGKHILPPSEDPGSIHRATVLGLLRAGGLVGATVAVRRLHDPPYTPRHMDTRRLVAVPDPLYEVGDPSCTITYAHYEVG